jgi:tRNA threonylcarbamoyladenosine biosynthesis protein TsaB
MILALDTATATASVAIYDRNTRKVLAELTWEARRRQTEHLLPAARSLLERAGLDPAALAALAVTTGPGSFTGVRIAISAAQGIALGLARTPRLIGIPTLSVTAAPWLAAAATAPETQVCACIQAGRGRYNWVTFGPGDLLHRPGAEEHQAGRAGDFAAALARLDRPIWLVGEGTPELAGAVAPLDHVHVVEPGGGLRRAGVLAWLAGCHLARGTTGELLQPLYLRTP